MTRYILGLLLVLTVSVGVRAQKVDKCATMEMDSILRRKFPELGTLADFENDLQQKVKQMEARYKAGRTTAGIITIPVVVHIIHNGEAVGQGRNLSQAQVQSQLAVLNEDFRRKTGTRGFNSDSRGADIEIEFCLATLNPQGQNMTEPGIDRQRGNQASYTRNQIEADIKPNTIWDPNRYFNIWVLDFTGTDENLVGYAQFPSQSGLTGLPESGGASNTDGVVVRYTSFGSAEKGTFPVLQAPYNLGRTLSHETGHWLGLRHIWGDGNCANDYVEDTPEQQSESRGCARGRVSCGTTNMVENYMDYSDDLCMNIFTRGQKTRILAVMENSPRRRELLNSNVCGNLVTSKPVPNFRSSRQRTLKGAKVTFFDLSANQPTQWQWTFEGGIPETSTERNPIITYNTPGMYKVTLLSTNFLGTSEPLARSGYIEVLTEGICSMNSNFTGTATVLKETAPATGYIAGHNSKGDLAKAEYFTNSLGYINVSGVSIQFGKAIAAKGSTTEATVTVIAWNARGFQSSPGAVLERKEVPLRTILQDVAQNQPTQIIFDRNAPVNGQPYFIGIELTYGTKDTVALVTNQNGEATQITSWEKNKAGEWKPYSINRGLNIAHAITPLVGMNESVQVSASSVFVEAGQPVTLTAKGASIFSWTPAQNLNGTLGAQVTAYPTQTTTYTVTGSGLDLCNNKASITVFVRNPTATESPLLDQTLTLHPNPVEQVTMLEVENEVRGAVSIEVYTSIGKQVVQIRDRKGTGTYSRLLDMRSLASGVYVIVFKLNTGVARRKLVKL